MNLGSAFHCVRWLVRDTFRQSAASRIAWLMLIVSGAVILLCLSAGVSGDRPEPQLPKGYPREHLTESEAKRLASLVPNSDMHVITGQFTLLFGAVQIPLQRTRVEAVRQVQLFLAGGVADTAGLLLALVWTAGFLPSFLEPGSVTVLLAKPVPRWSILTGKFLGVVLFVLVQATFFVVGTWAALGLRTAVWDPLYLLCIPLLVMHFAIFFSFSTLLAVWTRSAVACTFGTILFWAMCWGMNYGHHAFLARQLDDPRTKINPATLLVLAGAPHAGVPGGVPWAGMVVATEPGPRRPAPPTPAATALVEVAYWVMPKPADMGVILFDALHAGKAVGELPEYRTLRRHGAFHFEAAVLSSLLFMVVALGLAGYEFVTTDY